MKRLIIAALALASVLPTQAQLFGSHSLGGAILGGIAGGIIGNNNGHRTAEGIAIGAGAGLVLGSLADRYQSDRSYYGYSGYSPSYYSAGISYGYPGYRYGYGYPYYRSYYYRPSSYYTPYRPSYAFRGAALGGIAGAIIGNNNGHHTAEGAAIGAGAGLVLGALADHSLHSRPVYSQPPVYVSPSVHYGYAPAYVTTTQSQPASTPTQVTIINNNYYGNTSPMSSANGLFGR